MTTHANTDPAEQWRFHVGEACAAIARGAFGTTTAWRVAARLARDLVLLAAGLMVADCLIAAPMSPMQESVVWALAGLAFVTWGARFRPNAEWLRMSVTGPYGARSRALHL